MRRSPPGDRSSPIAFALACAVALACGGDAEVTEATRTLSSTFERANEPPTIASLRFEPATPTPGESVRVVAEVQDPDGDPVKMIYEWSLRGEPVGRSTPKLMLREARRGDLLAVVAVASDGRDESRPARREIAVGNRAPKISRLGISPALEITAGQEIGLRPEGSDPDGDPLEYRYAWRVNGEAVDGEASAFDTSGLASGDVVTVEVRGDDRSDQGPPFASPPIRVVNQAPRVLSRPRPSADGGAFRYRVVAEDPDGDVPLQFTLENAPDGMEIDARSGEVLWRPRSDQAGRHAVRVVVDDQHGGTVAHVFEVDVAGAPPAATGS